MLWLQFHPRSTLLRPSALGAFESLQNTKQIPFLSQLPFPSGSVAAPAFFLPFASRDFCKRRCIRGLSLFSSFIQHRMSVSTTRHVIVLGESNCGKVRASELHVHYSIARHCLTRARRVNSFAKFAAPRSSASPLPRWASPRKCVEPACLSLPTHSFPDLVCFARSVS